MIIFLIVFLVYWDLAPNVVYNTKITCELKDGEWKKQGMRQKYGCVTTYGDAGNICNASSECEGTCDGRKKGEPGTCSRTDSRFGCGATIETINAGGGIRCMD